MIASTAVAITAIAMGKVTGLEAAPYLHPLDIDPPLVLADVSFMVNGEAHALNMDTRTTLLDALREHLHFTG
ncbi:MAG: hypothetical protein ABIU77_09075, partial [Ferruginibacter sp.]